MKNERFVGKVVNVFDPEMAGRLSIRIYGIHDDESRVPDSMLPWARCVFPVTNPVHSGIAGATTGIMPGSTIVGYFADDYKQVPLVDGVLGSMSINGFPAMNIGKDFNPIINDSIMHIGISELKFLSEKTIGSVKYLGQDIGRMLNEVKMGNISSALDAARTAIDSFNAIKDFVQNSPIEQINSVVQGYASDLSQLAENEVQALITNNLGNVVSFVGAPDGSSESAINTANKALENVSHIIGALGTRKSKSAITSTQDAINKLSGHRFIMGNMMGSLDSSLAKLRIQMNKGK